MRILNQSVNDILVGEWRFIPQIVLYVDKNFLDYLIRENVVLVVSKQILLVY